MMVLFGSGKFNLADVEKCGRWVQKFAKCSGIRIQQLAYLLLLCMHFPFLIHIWFSLCNVLIWICFLLSPLISFDDHDREKDVVLLPTELGDEEANASVSSLLSLKNVEVPENEPSMSTSTLYFKKLMHSECMYERTCYIYPWGRLCLLVCKFSLPVEVFCLQTHRR